MSERDHLLSALIQEVLGPRSGPREVLASTEDPRNEYVTGVLAPRDARERPGIEAEAELLEQEGAIEGEEDQSDPAISAAPAVAFSPALDPRALPHSIGLAFVVESPTRRPLIEICTTWARYTQVPASEDWQREPAHHLTGVTCVDGDSAWPAAGPGVALYLRSRAVPGAPAGTSRHRISLYLVNTTAPIDPGRIATPELVFQPQIRVHCAEDTRLAPLPGGLTPDHEEATVGRPPEDESLALLYRHRRPLARGHLCGAVWAEIDPERPHEQIPLPDAAPFRWVDADVVPKGERAKFTPADVRTDLVPCYPVEAPEMEWRDAAFPIGPLLDPMQLAEMWQPNDVVAALEPLTDGYAAWIAQQRQTLPTIEPTLQTVGARHIQQCDTALARMREGIRLIVSDDDVRLAFCFANRAIALQSSWAREGQVVPWRPFQLAFILLNIAGVADRHHADRGICDLLWFPTGGGKTEAYLGLAAFTLALRRRRAALDTDGHRMGGGLGVISRYTLRLLTIQQFRRALGLITACEVLRVAGLGGRGAVVGWRPRACPLIDDFIWGTSRFAAGLWVGGSVTPNSLHHLDYKDERQCLVHVPGAFELLTTSVRRQRNLSESPGEPAQVLSCPACRWNDGQTAGRQTVLAVPEEGFVHGRHQLHYVLSALAASSPPQPAAISTPEVRVARAWLTPTAAPGCATLSVEFDVVQNRLTSDQVDAWWSDTIEPAVRALGNQDVELACARPSRPGYFLRYYTSRQSRQQPCDFELFCPNPECQLNRNDWAEKVPLRSGATVVPATLNYQWQDALPAFRTMNGDRSSRIPIPACTVDDQVYHRCPSLLVATADKFARLSFEPKAATVFGCVERYHARWGYYRVGCPPSSGDLPQSYRDDPPGMGRTPLHRQVPAFEAPDLILQDELHLIEGPLGSMVGLYETAVELLAQRIVDGRRVVPKYVASTATVRQAEPQVQALFGRRLAPFPPPCLSADDSFFAATRETHPLDAQRPGRLYVGICAPGRGAQTPIVRIWSALLGAVFERRGVGVLDTELDRFWTLVGYFNAIRELAGARALYRQDIPEWMAHRAKQRGAAPRLLASDGERPLELSSRIDSLLLPSLLERLARSLGGDVEDAVLATAMFGTGVDVDRLGLMVVHGQPKTTASYIQATGRVGRSGGGLLATFLRASRPRDLNHYEFFTGYHRALYGYVEPVTVAPFSPRARERGLGPLMVAVLRDAAAVNGQPVPADLRVQQRIRGDFHSCASRIDAHWSQAAVHGLPDLLEARAAAQPAGRRPPPGNTKQEAAAALDVWRSLAQRFPATNQLVYSEPALARRPTHPVVLGDPHHQAAGLRTAYRNAPSSLREVEATTRFQT